MWRPRVHLPQPGLYDMSYSSSPVEQFFMRTAWMGPLALITASAQYSLPLTPVNVASKAEGPVEVVVLDVPGQATMAASWFAAGIHCRQLLRSVWPSQAVARICRTLPCTKR